MKYETWMLIIIVILIAVGFMIFNILSDLSESKENQPKQYQVGEIIIDEKNLGNIVDYFGEGKVLICDIKKNKCGVLEKVRIEDGKN